MSKIAVIHPLIDGIGGAEKVALYIAKGLHDNGHDVTLISRIRLSLDLLASTVEFPLDSIRIRNPEGSLGESLLYKVTGGRANELRRLLALKKALNNLSNDYDLVIETQSNIPSPVDISYIHFPVIIRDKIYGEGGPLRRMYDWLTTSLARKMSWPRQSRMIVANSNWTRGLISLAYGRDACVLHPPVETKAKIREKDNLIVTISRFTPEKKLHLLLKIASNINDIQYIIMGGVQGRSSWKYYERLKEEARKLSNLELIPNPDRKILEDYLSRAKIYLHPPFIEHFGISVAEASQLGAIPIVYRDGGAWTDIAGKISGLLGYYNLEEARNIIRKILSNPSLEESLRVKAINVGESFRYENFLRKLSCIVRIIFSRDPCEC